MFEKEKSYKAIKKDQLVDLVGPKQKPAEWVL